MLRFLTAGESHGKAEISILKGIPAGLSVTTSDIQKELDKRRCGVGRGGRGKIETDKVEILSGVRFEKTLGSPIALIIKNLDHDNWKDIMNVDDNTQGVKLPHLRGVLTNPRPGHADFAGSIKYKTDDLRNIIERSSARETVMRLAVGAICKKLLKEFDINITSRIVQVGKVQWFKSLDSKELEKVIMEAIKRKDTLGGVIEVTAQNVPVGLGNFMQWDRRLDGKIAQGLMSIPSVKAVEIGEGIKNASLYGSNVHDEIFFKKKFFRKTNNAGGIEGGVTNGQDIVCRIFLKPISTLGIPLKTVDMISKKSTCALIERSDVCVVPRAGVIGESMLAFVLSDAITDKFGSDTVSEIKNNFNNFYTHVT